MSERGIGEYNRKYSSRGTEPAIAAHVEDAVYVSVRSYLLYRGGESPPSLLRFSAPFTFSHSPSLSLFLCHSVYLSLSLSLFSFRLLLLFRRRPTGRDLSCLVSLAACLSAFLVLGQREYTVFFYFSSSSFLPSSS